MSYDPHWTNGNAQGRLESEHHAVCLSDPLEISAAINRRLRLTYQGDHNVSSQICSGAYVRAAPIATASFPPFDNLRSALSMKVLHAPIGGQGGVPSSPTAMQWLWPVADGDEDKIIVGGTAGEGQVGLFYKLNETGSWVDPILTPGVTGIRAAHFNELRQGVEWVHRGRWKMPIYLTAGIFSILPDTPWIEYAIANNGTDEVRCLGFAILRLTGSPIRGLTDVTVRSGSSLELLADVECTAGAYHCLRPLDFVNTPNLPTWNEYLPSNAWASAGGLGSEDSTLIGSVNLEPDVPGYISNSALVTALQAMVDGAQQHFLFRRLDTGFETVNIIANLVIEFEINASGSGPN